MKIRSGNCAILFVLAGVVAFSGGCKSKPKAGVYGSDSGIYGGTIGGDVPMGSDNSMFPADGQRGLFESVLFAYDSSQVNPEESPKVEAVAKHLSKGKAGGVIVEGHCDERGSREYNQALGERRAQAIRDYLISLGANSANIQTRSMGEEMPASLGHDEESWRLNRRGEFVIY